MGFLNLAGRQEASSPVIRFTALTGSKFVSWTVGVHGYAYLSWLRPELVCFSYSWFLFCTNIETLCLCFLCSVITVVVASLQYGLWGFL